jgi:hypothetical protein
MQLADRWLRCRQLPLLRHEIQARQATPPLPLPCRDAPRRSARRRQSCRQRSTAEIALGGVEPPRAAVPPSSPGWRGSNAIRPIETTRVHDRFVKSFQYLLTDLHQFDILQSGSAVGGVVPCPIWVKSGKSQCEQMFSALPPRADVAQRSRHVRFVPQADSCTATMTSLGFAPLRMRPV